MPCIDLIAEVHAPIELVFDLCRSVDVHVESTQGTNERAIDGVTHGLMGMGDRVTWRATHLGVRQSLTSEITRYERPRMFRDSMVSGAFRRFDHDHIFSERGELTLVEERFDFTSPCGLLGRLANRAFLMSYLRRFLWRRLQHIKRLAEAEIDALDSPSQA